MCLMSPSPSDDSGCLSRTVLTRATKRNWTLSRPAVQKPCVFQLLSWLGIPPPSYTPSLGNSIISVISESVFCGFLDCFFS